MNNPDIPICDNIESRMSDIILKINQTHSIFDADKLHSELRTLDWTFYQVWSNEIKKFERDTAQAKEYSLDEEQTTYDDLLDALRLSLKGYHVE
jgi:hypothetical protein